MKSFDDAWIEARAIERKGIDAVDANIWFEKGRKEAYDDIYAEIKKRK